jgi:hypothetical protein
MKLRAKDNFSSHAIVRIVRMTVETNMATSKDLYVFDVRVVMRHRRLTLV